jgi:hypothetical protein
MHKPEVAVQSKAFLGLIHRPHGSVKCGTIIKETLEEENNCYVVYESTELKYLKPA